MELPGVTGLTDADMTFTCLESAVASSLQRVPGHLKEQERERLLCRRFSVPLQRVHVGPSAIHGQGVFTLRDVKAGEVLTLYPGDAVRSYPVTEGGIGDARDAVVFGDHLPAHLRNRNDVLHDLSSYCYDVDGYYSIVGFPSLADDIAYVGHMCNDSASLPSLVQMSEGDCEPDDYERHIEDTVYWSESKGGQNADFVNLHDAHVAIVAKRDISAGQEVLLSYGLSYWRMANSFTWTGV
eukprot:TRINITY_DN70933_c0_g1_i1.p1 TRINITY_DN70933_c0_g1~~TRINITY_DN70933_c0_g1_i1.p1  ORF type:complete len:239 (-),score=6.60 TRINITY_DN70933_c0_g1_i1:414-1130(-)